MEECMKKIFKLFRCFLLVGCILNTLPSNSAYWTVYAQTNVGRISGTVTDSSGGVIQGAAVKITNDATGLSRSATTDESGFYVVTNLLPGAYNISVEHQGFKRALVTGHTLVTDGRLTVDISIEPGGVSESVSVTAVSSE